jgi:glycosyltransferase involved in cell wall biosynthesis
MVNLARGFIQRGLSVDLVQARAGGVYGSDLPRDVRIVDLRASRVSTSLPGLIRYLRRERPAVVLSTLDTANLVAVLAVRLAGVRTRIVVRQANSLSADSRMPDRRQSRILPSILLFLLGRLYRWADEVIAVSQGVARELAIATKLPPERIRVAPNPIVTPELFAMARESPDHPWFAPGAVPVILGAGRLTTLKDFPTLIRALSVVRQKCRARLVILGEGEDRPSLEALIRELALEDCVSLPGFVRNPFAYMATSAVFALSSLSEGMPGVLIQALACGAPVVATDCHSGPREILLGGQFGRLVPPRDVAALAEAIIDTLKRPRPTIPEDVWRPFSHDAAVDAYLRILLPEGHEVDPAPSDASTLAAPSDARA